MAHRRHRRGRAPSAPPDAAHETAALPPQGLGAISALGRALSQARGMAMTPLDMGTRAS